MHALIILHRRAALLLVGIHARRLAVLLEAVAATVSGPRPTLTEIGRRCGGGSDLRHRIKRADRLLDNVHLQRDARQIYTALGRMLLTGVAEPLIVIDRSDPKEDQSLHLLRASLPVGGRSPTLYEEVHTRRKPGNRQVQHRFLQRLKALLPATAAPIIVADSGFKVPFHREVERLGWRWVGRVRGRDDIKLKNRWSSCKRVLAEASETPTALGIGEWVRSNPLRAAFVPVRKPKQGRRAKTASGKRARSKTSDGRLPRGKRSSPRLMAQPRRDPHGARMAVAGAGCADDRGGVDGGEHGAFVPADRYHQVPPETGDRPEAQVWRGFASMGQVPLQVPPSDAKEAKRGESGRLMRG